MEFLNLLQYLNERVNFDFLAFCEMFNWNNVDVVCAKCIPILNWFVFYNIFDNSVAEDHLLSSV